MTVKIVSYNKPPLYVDAAGTARLQLVDPPPPPAVVARKTLVDMVHVLDDTLADRGKLYGVFKEQAAIIQDIKAIMRNTKRWGDMRNDQREALEMIISKIARILNGDPDYVDSWHDIAGYARLVEDRLIKEVKKV